LSKRVGRAEALKETSGNRRISRGGRRFLADRPRGNIRTWYIIIYISSPCYSSSTQYHVRTSVHKSTDDVHGGERANPLTYGFQLHVQKTEPPSLNARSNELLRQTQRKHDAFPSAHSVNSHVKRSHRNVSSGTRIKTRFIYLALASRPGSLLEHMETEPPVVTFLLLRGAASSCRSWHRETAAALGWRRLQNGENNSYLLATVRLRSKPFPPRITRESGLNPEKGFARCYSNAKTLCLLGQVLHNDRQVEKASDQK